jgi:hypothetical protein
LPLTLKISTSGCVSSSSPPICSCFVGIPFGWSVLYVKLNSHVF